MGYIIIGLVVLVVIWALTSYNGFIKLKNKVEEAFSTMDVYLKQRYDLIPNLVETVKGYAKHEEGTLEKVIAARNKAMNAKSADDTVEGENQLNQTLKSLFALAEAYPDLKANTSFLNLQEQLQKVETDIAQARKYYNGIVRQYNTGVELFPQSILAGIFGFKRKPMYKMADTTQRENVAVKF